MPFLKRHSWVLITIIYAGMMYYTNSTRFADTIRIGGDYQKYNTAISNFVSAAYLEDIPKLKTVFSELMTSDYLEANKTKFKEMFSSGSINSLLLLSSTKTENQGKELTQLEYDITLGNNSSTYGRFIFASEQNATKLLSVTLNDGKRVKEAASIFNSNLDFHSYLLGGIFIFSFVLIVLATFYVIQDRPRKWFLWLLFVTGFGFVLITANYHLGTWDYQLIHPVFGWPLIIYTKSPMTHLFLEFTIPVGAIVYLSIRERIPKKT